MQFVSDALGDGGHDEEGVAVLRLIIQLENSSGAGPALQSARCILVDLLGLDTVMHVAEHLQESYGESFYVAEGMQKLVADRLRKTGGSGFYEEARRAADPR